MYLEWLEAREKIYAIKKRNKQGRSEREHLGTSTFRQTTKAGDSYSNEPKEKEQKEEKVKKKFPDIGESLFKQELEILEKIHNTNPTD